MRRAAVVALGAVVAGALWLSGSATVELGQRHHVPTLALPALVLVLEVASVIGTALWVTAADRRARVKPTLVVLMASGVAGVGGWQAYSWLGLVASISVVLVTEMIADRWADLGRIPAGPPAADRPGKPPRPPAMVTVVDEVAELDPQPLDDEQTAALSTVLATASAANPDVTTPDRSAEAPSWSDGDVLADLRGRGEVDPSARALRNRYGMRHDRAARLVAAYAEQADRPDRSGVGTGAVR